MLFWSMEAAVGSSEGGRRWCLRIYYSFPLMLDHMVLSPDTVSFNIRVGRWVLINMTLKVTKANTNYCQSAWRLQLLQTCFVYVLEVDGKGKQTSWFSSQPRNQEEEKNILAYHDTFSVLFWISRDFSQTFRVTDIREKSKWITWLIRVLLSSKQLG